MNIEIKKNLAKNWFILLRDIICYEIEELEKEFGVKKNKKPKRFKSQIWKKPNNNDEGGVNLEFYTMDWCLKKLE